MVDVLHLQKRKIEKCNTNCGYGRSGISFSNCAGGERTPPLGPRAHFVGRRHDDSGMLKSVTEVGLLSKLWPTTTLANSYQRAKTHDCTYLKPDSLLIIKTPGIGATSARGGTVKSALSGLQATAKELSSTVILPSTRQANESSL